MILRLAVMLAALLLVPAAHAQPTPPIPGEAEIPVALLVDITSGQVLYARSPDRRFIPASVTKVMTLYTAFELIEKGQLDPRQTLTMRDETWREWNGEGSTMWIGAGDVVPVDDLLTGIANISANDASVLLAEGQAGSVAGWTDLMNAQARALGMTGSHFNTPNGWPDDGATFTTASDLVRLAEALLRRHPSKYAHYIGRPGFEYNGIAQINHDPMIGVVRGADGIKTGHTNEAGYTYLGTAKRGGQRLVLVIAGAEGYGLRRQAARAFIEWGFDAFERERLFDKGALVGNVRVQGGSARTVALKTDRQVFVNVPKGREAELKLSISYDGPLRAPFAAGEEVATLVVEVPGREPAQVPLLAAEGVEEAGFFARIANAFARWLT